ncbi:unnamed protein product [Withania somnifera]
MAAAAYDVAALALKGSENAVLNFPNNVTFYPKLPLSPSPADIQSAAATAAEMMASQGHDDWSSGRSGGKTTRNKGCSVESPSSSSSGHYAIPIGSTQTISGEEEYVDEEELFDFPSLVVNMAEAMMLSPPRINSFPSEDYSSGDFDAESLWSY